MAGTLLTERAVFERARKDLLHTHHGEYVVIQGETIHGTFPTESLALATAYRLLGDRTAFLVRRVERIEEEAPLVLGVAVAGA